MISHQCKIRVLYPDTDKMGYVHHSNYARYCEKARWELLRELGITYKEIEDSGVMLPVVGMSFKYLKPAVYDELLLIETELKEIKGPLIKFVYSIFNEENELINKGETTLAFVNAETRKPCHPSLLLLKAINESPISKDL